MSFVELRDPKVWAVPFYIVALLVEMRLLRARRAPDGRTVLGYERRDTWASLAMGTGSLVTVGLIQAGAYALGTTLWSHRLTDLGSGVLGWTAAMVAWDFTYYWEHRIEHEVRLFWASHVNHHSSQRYNLSTALRQPWTPVLALALYPLWSLVGVRPKLMVIAGGINLIWQFWIHTEAVDRLARPFELILNTPSHHRVHHGSNREYLDRNYGGILIVWDRLFGSFEPERERVVYGLTKNIHTYNPLRIAFHEYAAIARDVTDAETMAERLRLVFAGPGYALAHTTSRSA